MNQSTYLVHSDWFAKQLDHIHDLNGIICIFLAYEFHKAITLVGLCYSVFWHVYIHWKQHITSCTVNQVFISINQAIKQSINQLIMYLLHTKNVKDFTARENCVPEPPFSTHCLINSLNTITVCDEKTDWQMEHQHQYHTLHSSALLMHDKIIYHIEPNRIEINLCYQFKHPKYKKVLLTDGSSLKK